MRSPSGRPVGHLTVLHDAACPLCARFASWLREQPTLVPLSLVPAGSAEARALFPGSTTRARWRR